MHGVQNVETVPNKSLQCAGPGDDPSNYDLQISLAFFGDHYHQDVVDDADDDGIDDDDDGIDSDDDDDDVELYLRPLPSAEMTCSCGVVHSRPKNAARRDDENNNDDDDDVLVDDDDDDDGNNDAQKAHLRVLPFS